MSSQTSRRILDDVVFVLFVYKQEKFIREGLNSAINQTCLPSKLVILDDASPDNSQIVIEGIIESAPAELNIEYCRNDRNLGLIAQLNKLNYLFKDKLLVFQSGDDVAYPNRVEETYNAWIENNKPPLIVAAYDEIDESGNLVRAFGQNSKRQKPYTLTRLINRRATIYGCCPAYHSEVFNRFGPIPDTIFNDDRVNTFRAMCSGGIFYMHQPLLKYRVGVGVSHLDQSTREERFIRLVTEAKRELKDIRSHLADLDKALLSPKEKKSARRALYRREKLMTWQASLSRPPSLYSIFKAMLTGLPVSRVWKLRKHLKR